MANRISLSFLSTILLFLILCSLTYGQFITGRPSSTPSDLISDGVHDDLRGQESCDQTYGFMPCTTTALGNVFLIIVYSYLMFHAATYLSSGSELLLEILGPGLVGGLLLPMLGAVPDAVLILVSGLSGSTETAQSQVSVGMGLLAGSTLMLLTVIWGTCVVVGKCDLHDSIAIDRKDTKGFSLTGSGVTTDIWSMYAARIMAISVVPFFVVQLPQLLNSTSGRHLAVLIALFFSLSLLVSYCLFQVFQPWIQSRRLAFVRHTHVKSGILIHLKKRSLGKLVRDDGTLNDDIVEKLFKMIDGDDDGFFSASELRALIVGIEFENMTFDRDDAVGKVMDDFDTSLDNKVDREEFKNGITRWLEEARRSGGASSHGAGHETLKYVTDFHEQTKREHYLLGDQSDEVVEGSEEARRSGGASSHGAGHGTKKHLTDFDEQTKRIHYLLGDQSDEVVEGFENPRRMIVKAVLLLLLGTVIAAAFANPLVDAVDNFSTATSIPSFFISFIVLPMATSSEAVATISYASQKKQRSASLTFSELYASVTIKNTLSMSVLLALVYVRGLTWDFSSEVLVILIVCVVMGAIASFRTTYPLWISSVAFLLYPFSLALVYVLDSFLGWS